MDRDDVPPGVGCPPRELLAEFQRGTLGPAASQALVNHLELCTPCAAVRRQLRFLRDANLAARLTDGRVLPVLHVQATAGRVVVVAPFVSGQDLSRLRGVRPESRRPTSTPRRAAARAKPSQLPLDLCDQ